MPKYSGYDIKPKYKGGGSTKKKSVYKKGGCTIGMPRKLRKKALGGGLPKRPIGGAIPKLLRKVAKHVKKTDKK